MGGFDGRVALVTGAARGVGASCASLLSADGAAVGMIDVAGRPPPAPFAYPLASGDDMAGVLKLIDAAGGRAVAKEADVGRADELEPAIKEIAAELGPIELAVLAAGVRGVAAIDQMSDVLAAIRATQDSRRLIVSAWNVGQLSQMALHPCHLLF